MFSLAVKMSSNFYPSHPFSFFKFSQDLASVFLFVFLEASWLENVF